MNSHQPNSDDQRYRLCIISKKDLLKLIPYSDQHLGRLEKAGKFPRRIQLGENRVGWLLWQVEAWIQSRTPRGGPDEEGSGGVPLSPLPQLRGGGAAMPIPQGGARHDR